MNNGLRVMSCIIPSPPRSKNPPAEPEALVAGPSTEPDRNRGKNKSNDTEIYFHDRCRKDKCNCGWATPGVLKVLLPPRQSRGELPGFLDVQVVGESRRVRYWISRGIRRLCPRQ